MTRTRVLYVGGLPRSGSTLTDLLLHHLPGHVGVGELHYIWRNCVVHNGLCSCGQRFSGCDFWQRVGKAAYGGWDAVDAKHVQRLQGHIDATSAIPWLLAPRRPRRFQDRLEEYSSLLDKLYRAVIEISGAEIVVDSSKRPSMAYVLRQMPSIDLRIAHITRDPRGVAYSFSKHVPLRTGVALKEEMPRSKPRKVARRWVSVNALIAALARLGVDTVHVRYEDLVADPRHALGRILAVEGVEPAAHDFDFLTADGVVVPPTHAVAAGRIRLQTGVMPLRLDEAWRHEMPASTRRLVSAMTLASRLRYGYRS